jgi:hypothetical protein
MSERCFYPDCGGVTYRGCLGCGGDGRESPIDPPRDDAQPMKTWEIDMEFRIRATLHFSGPKTEAHAQSLVRLIMAGQLGDIGAFIKWPDAGAHQPPVPTIVDSDPRIVAIREIPE